MANSYKGKIEAIEGIQSFQRQGKEPFQKRRVMLDLTRFDGITGERGFEKHVIFDFCGKNASLPDSFTVGDVVEVFFDVDSYKATKKDGTQDWFTSVRGYRIEKVNIQHNAPQGAIGSTTMPQQQGNQQSQAPQTRQPFSPSQQSFSDSNAPF